MTFNIKDGATTSHIDKEIIGRLEMDSFALVPLVSKDRNLGILVADNFSSKKSIHDEDVERLRAFANHVSLAIENSRLYKSLKQTVEELQSAYAELQQNRDKLIRSERLSAVGMVAAQVAHDIRNPMTIIGGFARRIFKQSKSGFNKINIGHIQIIINEIERLENILNDLLSYTSPEVPHGDLVDLNSLVKSTCEMYAPMMEQNNVTLEEQLDPNLPELVLDEDLIKRATINIIKNSIEAMPDGGSITVATGIDNQCARIEISDRGEGVDKDNTDKLFEPFFTTKAKGTGLGLTISDQIIRSHGGTIEVLKRKEKGVSVIFQLPVTTSVEHIERIKS
jgi:signal transduction histidine kinase